ncbi:MAG TPA: head-tail connector protein [Xanthobacteraceae bacterium]|nr:head-tail connector protein [Xanthobacteraceae bacterium]
MSAILLKAPEIEPLSLLEAKQFLRVEHDADDTVIAALIAAARGHVEAQTRCALLTQTWRLSLDCWPGDGRIAPRLAPLQQVAAARVFDGGGVPQQIDVGRFVVDLAGGVIAAPAWSLPLPGRPVGGIELDVVCGFGNAPSDVPEVLRHAVRTLIAHWYENRGLTAIGQSVAMMPASVAAMIGAYRVRAL